MMRNRTALVLSLLTLLLWPFPPLAVQGADHRGHPTTGPHVAVPQAMADYVPMPAPGKKVPIGGGYYLIYGFDKKPRLGTAIMKVELFTAAGQKETSLEVWADADMPSMRGAHAMGERVFKLSQKGDYLLPIPIVMPGDWEVRFTVLKAGKAIFKGRYNFNV